MKALIFISIIFLCTKALDYINLKKEGPNYLMPITVTDSKTSNSLNGSALLGLYTSDGYFFDHCMGFSSDISFALDLSDEGNIFMNDLLPYFSVQRSYIKDFDILVYPDNRQSPINLTLNEESFHVKGCLTPHTTNGYLTSANIRYGKNAMALLGMGFSFYHASSYNFSIFLDDDNSDYKLIFGMNPTIPKKKEPELVFSVTEYLEMGKVVDAITVGNSSFSIDDRYGIIFDLNIPGIGLPKYAYDLVRNSLSKNYGIDLTTRSYNTKEQFPNISFSIYQQVLIIPPEIYLTHVRTDSGEYFYLNFFAVSSELTNADNYYYVNSRYKNFIILGASFLAYYYTVFEEFDKSFKASLYLAYANPSSNTSPSYFYIYGLIMIIVIIFVVCCYKWRQRAQTKQVVIQNQENNSQDAYISPVQKPYSNPFSHYSDTAMIN